MVLTLPFELFLVPLSLQSSILTALIPRQG